MIRAWALVLPLAALLSGCAWHKADAPMTPELSAVGSGLFVQRAPLPAAFTPSVRPWTP